MITTIHAIWLGHKLTPLSFACIDDWKKQGYQVKLWTENDPEIIEWINNCQFSRECYKRKLYAFVTDYLRLKVLQHSGGLYLDTDVTIQKNPFALFENLDFSVGFEDKKMLGTAVIYASKNSIILEKLISFYETDIMKSDLFMGPGIMTTLIINSDNNNNERYKLYPPDFFYAYQGEHMHFKKTENSYLIHWFQHSWKNPKQEVFLKSKHEGLLGKFYTWQKYFFRCNKK